MSETNGTAVCQACTCADGGRAGRHRQPTAGGGEYLALLAQADPTRRPIRKRRRVFLYANQYFEWDIFVDPRPGLEILEVEVDSLSSPIELPPFLPVEREGTGDMRYANHRIALHEAG